MTRLICILLTLLFSLSGPAMGEYSDFGRWSSAAKTTTLELNTATTWGRAETLADHFTRHGGDFAATSADDYANMASRFLQESQAVKAAD